MRTRFCLVLVLLTVGSGCRQSASPPASSDPKASESPAKTKNDAKPSSSPLNNLVAAIGIGREMPLPDGLVPGGDCPPPDPKAAEDIQAQAKAVVPLQEGLTLAYTWTRNPQESDYECLIQVKTIAAVGIDTTLSCDHPERHGPFLRRICRADLRSAHMLHTAYGVVKVIGASGDEEPETITGATAFSLSSEELAQLKRTGAMTHHYVQLGPSGQLIKDSLGDFTVEGRETTEIIVNDRPVGVPVIKVRGTLKTRMSGQQIVTEDMMVILDDERFPLLIDQSSSGDTAGSRIQFTKVTYPGGKRESPPSGGGSLKSASGSLEEGLLEEKRVDVYGIYFDFDSDRIRPESEPVLQEIASILKRHPEWRLSIEGHTDNVGGNGQYNLELSRRRSEAVRKALVSRFGISDDRLSSGGYGAAVPKDTNDTPRGRARNRRVELVRR